MKYLIVEKITKRCSSLFRAARRQANHNPRNPPPRASAIDRMRCCSLLSSHWLEGGGNQGNIEGLLLSCVMYPDSSNRPSVRTSVRIVSRRSSRIRRVPKGPPSARSQKSAEFIVFAKGILNKTGAQIFFQIFATNGAQKRPKRAPLRPEQKKCTIHRFCKRIS